MKKLFYVASWISIALIVIGIFSFDNFRDRLYLAAAGLMFVAIISGIHHVIQKVDK